MLSYTATRYTFAFLNCHRYPHPSISFHTLLVKTNTARFSLEQPFQLITSTQIISCSWVVQGVADKWGGGGGGLSSMTWMPVALQTEVRGMGGQSRNSLLLCLLRFVPCCICRMKVTFLCVSGVSTKDRWKHCCAPAAELLFLTHLSARLTAECLAASCPGGAFFWAVFPPVVGSCSSCSWGVGQP